MNEVQIVGIAGVGLPPLPGIGGSMFKRWLVQDRIERLRGDPPQLN